jgi:hypothetical protein
LILRPIESSARVHAELDLATRIKRNDEVPPAGHAQGGEFVAPRSLRGRRRGVAEPGELRVMSRFELALRQEQDEEVVLGLARVTARTPRRVG